MGYVIIVITRKQEFVMSTSSRLWDYWVSTRNKTRTDALLPLLLSTGLLLTPKKNKQKPFPRKIYLNDIELTQCPFQDPKVLDPPVHIRFSCLRLSLGSDPCWNKTLNNYHVCPRCVLWRHRQRGGNWGERHAAMQGWLSIHWPQQFPPWRAPWGTSWTPHRLVSSTHKLLLGFYSFF